MRTISADRRREGRCGALDRRNHVRLACLDDLTVQLEDGEQREGEHVASVWIGIGGRSKDARSAMQRVVRTGGLELTAEVRRIVARIVRESEIPLTATMSA